MRIAFALGLAAAAVLAPLGVAAQDVEIPAVAYPKLPAQAASAAGFAPKGWPVEAEAKGDLNADGIDDLALVIRNNDPRNVITHDGFGPSPFDSNPRILAVAFGEAGGGYRLAAENHDLVPRPESPTLEDPFGEGELTIAKGVLKLKLHFFANAGGWTMFNSTFSLRWQNARFELIGFDRFLIRRNTGEVEELSVNFMTRKAKIGTGTIDTDEMSTRWTKASSLKPLPLDRIGDGLEFDPLPEPSSED